MCCTFYYPYLMINVVSLCHQDHAMQLKILRVLNFFILINVSCKIHITTLHAQFQFSLFVICRPPAHTQFTNAKVRHTVCMEMEMNPVFYACRIWLHLIMPIQDIYAVNVCTMVQNILHENCYIFHHCLQVKYTVELGTLSVCLK